MERCGGGVDLVVDVCGGLVSGFWGFEIIWGREGVKEFGLGVPLIEGLGMELVVFFPEFGLIGDFGFGAAVL